MINNKSEVIFTSLGIKNLKAKSNNVSIDLLNPIIIFQKCFNGKKIIVYINNNSKVKLYNLIFYDCSNNFISGSVEINDILFDDLNPKKGICLGTLENAAFMKISYRVKNNCSHVYLYYEIKMNKRINKFVLKSI